LRPIRLKFSARMVLLNERWWGLRACARQIAVADPADTTNVALFSDMGRRSEGAVCRGVSGCCPILLSGKCAPSHPRGRYAPRSCGSPALPVSAREGVLLGEPDNKPPSVIRFGPTHSSGERFQRIATPSMSREDEIAKLNSIARIRMQVFWIRSGMEPQMTRPSLWSLSREWPVRTRADSGDRRATAHPRTAKPRALALSRREC
jgi:hypothetical protein